MKSMTDIAEVVAGVCACHCELDSWQPTIETGHTAVCPIHKITMSIYLGQQYDTHCVLRLKSELAKCQKVSDELRIIDRELRVALDEARRTLEALA